MQRHLILEEPYVFGNYYSHLTDKEIDVQKG